MTIAIGFMRTVFIKNELFVDPKNRDLGIVKRQRKPRVKLIVAPFPDRMKSSPGFFFQPEPTKLLTGGIQP